ncbi:MAG: MBL fold metallo-hydrolase [Nitrospinales bacterium]
MKLLFLGTGTSTGVPSLCCDCEVCLSDNPKNHRLRASVLIQNDGCHTLIDTSTDLRQQCLRYKIKEIHNVLYTHCHADHVHGIDELRSFNFFNKTTIPCYGRKETLAALMKNFGYIFNPGPPTGGGIPKLTLNEIGKEPFQLGGVNITPLHIIHGKMGISGYRLDKLAYITDASKIPEDTRAQLLNLDLLVLNALGYKSHPTHFCLEEALTEVEKIKPKRAILTHINHAFDHEKVNGDLPEGVELAYDGMTVEL